MARRCCMPKSCRGYRVFQLLVGLNPKYEQVQIQLLSCNTYLSLTKSTLTSIRRKGDIVLCYSLVDFQDACIESLSSAARNTSYPKELIKVTFNVAMNHINQAVSRSTVLQELEKDPRATQALKN